MNMKINQENWTSSHYYSDPLRAFISLGASPSDSGAEAQIHYLVTVTDKDFQEVFQSTHLSLDSAIAILNEKYGHWNMIDAGQKVSGDGCSSCAAH